jgi:dipeptidyl aminopeptidase/acylaminoacyl peptidase
MTLQDKLHHPSSLLYGPASCLIALLIQSVLYGQAYAPKPKRPITAEDAIRMTRLADRSYRGGASSTGRVANFSPDGKHFVIVLEKGNIQQDTNDYSLMLYNTAETFGSPKPDLLVTMSTTSPFRDAIADIRWLDEETLAFLGESLKVPSQVYTFSITTHTLTRLTNHPTALTNYDITRDGREIVFAAEPPAHPSHRQEEDREGIVITTQLLEELLMNGPPYPDAQLFVQRQGKEPTEVPISGRVNYTGRISLSPDGRYALVGVWMRGVPAEWVGYRDKNIREIAATHTKGQLAPLSRYLLLDTTNRSLVPLLNAPNASGFPQITWASDSRSVSLKTYLPLDVADPEERKARSKDQMPVEIRLPTRELRRITENDLQRELERANQKKDAGLDVVLEEDVNTPPKIYAIEPGNKQKVLLLDLNPQLSELDVGRVETVTWKGTDGNETQGGLYFPPNYESRKRYPLIIQTHGFNPKRFSIDGINEWSSAFAARPLAGRGFIVLQAGSSKVVRDITDTTSEGPAFMAGFEGAIDDLDRKGLVDRNLVGISGFSRTVYEVGYALTHSSYRFQAAVLVDGISGGYFQYLAWASNGDRTPERLNGGPPFGSGLGGWMKNSPGFNVDKVSAPVRLVALGRGSVLEMWEWFAELSLQNKPVDFVEIRDGVHLLHKPSHRRIAMQGVVDWFRFWLKGEEDPDPAKVDQYKRWRDLRKLHEQNEKNAPAPSPN